MGWVNLAAVSLRGRVGNYEGCIQASQKVNELEPDPFAYQNIALSLLLSALNMHSLAKMRKKPLT